MNCKHAQRRISEALNSGESGFHEELNRHLQKCGGCRAFSVKQAALFQTMDSHLRVISHAPVPVSLFAGLRVRLQEGVSPRPWWIPTWRLAAIASLVVLAAAMRIEMRRSEMSEHASGSTPVTAIRSASVNRIRPADHQVQTRAPKPAHSRVMRKAPVPVRSSTQEVLVLREEQEAFRHFVSKISKDRESAIALTSATAETGEAPVEIALLTIQSVEVKPLDPNDRE
jgi:hypothetical protein